jgi:MFS-type transporter involved in bile tolerance (Atg22 family)
MNLIIAIQLGLNTLLTIANLYYLYSFYKLELKKFHLMMFGMLQVCFAMVIAAYLISIELLKEQSNKALYFTGDGLY